MRPPSILTGRWTGGWFLRALAVIGLSFAYFSAVFQIFRHEFWSNGLGDWIDPYFINGLLEHWTLSITRLSDPLSPPVFYPAAKTLGYSHGLIQYAAIYLPLRALFHSFQAHNLTVFMPLPGFSSIRDPGRIVYSYELAAVLAVALMVSRPSVKPAYRVAVMAMVVALSMNGRAQDAFTFDRPNNIYERWVSAPIDIDRSCSSFFIKPASPEYSSRSVNKWSLYSLDAFFITMKYSIPTLNGYSAWAPPAYTCRDPESSGYMNGIDQWIQQNGLTGVCELDIDARTMRPYRPSS